MIIGVACKTGDIVMALPNPFRHSDVIARIQKLDLDDSVAFDWGKSANQGFIDEFGKYYTRSEAAKHAYECGQLKIELSAICSEDLW